MPRLERLLAEKILNRASFGRARKITSPKHFDIEYDDKL
jgi:hypothetical protein